MRVPPPRAIPPLPLPSVGSRLLFVSARPFEDERLRHAGISVVGLRGQPVPAPLRAEHHRLVRGRLHVDLKYHVFATVESRVEDLGRVVLSLLTGPLAV